MLQKKCCLKMENVQVFQGSWKTKVQFSRQNEVTFSKKIVFASKSCVWLGLQGNFRLLLNIWVSCMTVIIKCEKRKVELWDHTNSYVSMLESCQLNIYDDEYNDDKFTQKKESVYKLMKSRNNSPLFLWRKFPNCYRNMFQLG